MIPYRKFSDIQSPEFGPPEAFRAPKAPKVCNEGANNARTLDSLAALAASCPELADEPVRGSVVANDRITKNSLAKEYGAKPAKPAKEGQQIGLSLGALPNTGQASHSALRVEAEVQAFESCLVEWLNQHPAPSQSGRCAWCGRPESPGVIVVPFGAEPGTHAWLHPECWGLWYQRRREEAVLALRRMGVTIGGEHDD
jgi:hypothetical protein